MTADIASMTADAYYNRRTVGKESPTDAELDTLAARVDDLNGRSTTTPEGFIDAQAELIDALLVRLDTLRPDQHDGRSETTT